MRIVFIGTPKFAIPSLRILVENGCRIAGVITAPDKPKGRGRKPGTSPVKDYALAQGLPLLQPVNLKDRKFQEELRALRADLQVVVAFRMLPEAVWGMPPLGSFNLHASLLPQYRGAAPINRVIMNGEKETGVTTFFLKQKTDTGSIIFQEKEHIAPTDTAGTLHEKLMKKGAQLVLKTVKAVASGEYPSTPQDGTMPIIRAPKIFRNDCEIDWTKNATEVINHIRGLSPHPAAWTKWLDKNLKVLEAKKLTRNDMHPAGEVYSDGVNYIRVNVADATLELTDIQMEGKKRMAVKDLLRGLKPQNP